MQTTLESGAILELSTCSFSEGVRLMKAVARELKSTQISLGSGEATKVGDIFQMNVGPEILNTVKNIIASLISSEEIEAAIWPCMERGSYTLDGVTHKINRDIFEDPAIRGDYIPVLKEALVFSLTPFFGGLKSLVKNLPGSDIATRK
jgi:hypothetical protein